MIRSPGQAVRLSTAQLLRDAVHTSLAATFTPTRRVLFWDGQPVVVPGFQVRADGTHAIVRYVQPRAGAARARRVRARAMLEQYRQMLIAQGWQADIVDERRKSPYLRCNTSC
jgi:hypothetical protein